MIILSAIVLLWSFLVLNDLYKKNIIKKKFDKITVARNNGSNSFSFAVSFVIIANKKTLTKVNMI
jgi:hypothetical protein